MTAIGVLGGILLMATGIFDPKPIGRVTWQMKPGELTLPPQADIVRWLDAPMLPTNFSLCLRTNHLRGEADVAYGLALDELRVGVSPLGYALVLVGETDVLPLQPWPHITPAGNEIWLDVHGSRVTMRLNRELLWTGEVTLPHRQVGIWGESWGETAVVEMERLQLSRE